MMILSEKLTPRITNAALFLICLLLISIAMIMQEVFGMHPCPLCITQRIFVVATGLVALVAAIHNPLTLGRRIYAVLGLITAGAGAGFSGRHVWLQNLPEDQVPACGPGLAYMFENFPIFEAFQLLLLGDGNCADVAWSFMSLSIPGWLLVGFTGLLVINAWQLIRKT